VSSDDQQPARTVDDLVAEWEAGGRVGPHPLSARTQFERGEDGRHPMVAGFYPPAPVQVRVTPLGLPPHRGAP
jgi:hypothetical protein